MHRKINIQPDIKKYIKECINSGKGDIKYWLKGENFVAEKIAGSIYEENEKLKNLLDIEIISSDYIMQLIETETNDSLILIYENILDLTERKILV